jgi:hypothetical protein
MDGKCTAIDADSACEETVQNSAAVLSASHCRDCLVGSGNVATLLMQSEVVPTMDKSWIISDELDVVEAIK